VIEARSTPRVAVSGANGRLGRGLLTAATSPTLAWQRPELDLDDPGSAAALVEQDRPALVVHAAAMTAVDEAAADPDAAMRRNGAFVGALARACVASGSRLVLVSTNEVFAGDRQDGRAYAEDDETRPRNAYGRSKLAGEKAALDAFAGSEGLWIVRTAWLYGPPGNDFPDKITAAADRLPATEPLPVVADEVGSPTSTVDLAAAIFELVEASDGGLFHLANEGAVSRLTWAQAVLALRRPDRSVRPISRSEFQRASDPPPWGPLDPSRAAGLGVTMRPWQVALADHLDSQDSSPGNE
jgi:dTDP-4-dehydrorhamnose reductase